jgi:DNA-binding protein Fis
MQIKQSDTTQTRQVRISDLEQELDLLKSKISESVNKIEQPVWSPLSEFVPAKQAANMIGISRATLQKHTEEGLLKRYRLGTKIYYRSDELAQAFRPD